MMFTNSIYTEGVLMQQIFGEIFTKIWQTVETYREFSQITLERNRESKPPR